MKLIDKIRNGERTAGTFLNLGSAVAAECAAIAGFDYVIIDLEHSQFGFPEAADMIKKQTFKRKLQDFCAYKDWRFNPEELLLSATEKARNDIRRKEDGQDVYYFYIDTTHSESLPVNLILGEGDSGGGRGDTPIFGE